jgi:hypothetical protein
VIQTPNEEGEKKEEEKVVHKGIAGSYDYKVDVKFAPPPSHRDLNKNGQVERKPLQRTSTSTSTSSNRSKSVDSSREAGASSTRPVPVPRSHAATPSVNFPPPPRPTNPGGACPPHSPRPSYQHSNEIQPPQQHGSHAPPQYSHAPTYSSNPQTPISQTPEHVPSVYSPKFDPAQFAPPPKPFKKPEMQDASIESVASSGQSSAEVAPPVNDFASLQIQHTESNRAHPPPPSSPPIYGDTASTYQAKIPPALKPKPSFDQNALSQPTRPVVKPIPSGIKTDLTPVKAGPPPIKPKPSSLVSQESKAKIPPVIKPKPSNLTEMANQKKPTPPPLKPKPSISKKPHSGPPPLKPKPSSLEMKNQHAVNEVISEVPSKNVDAAEKVAIVKPANVSGNSGDDVVSAEDEEYNPFKRYLKAAVPRENDRFHNR